MLHFLLRISAQCPFCRQTAAVEKLRVRPRYEFCLSTNLAGVLRVQIYSERSVFASKKRVVALLWSNVSVLSFLSTGPDFLLFLSLSRLSSLSAAAAAMPPFIFDAPFSLPLSGFFPPKFGGRKKCQGRREREREAREKSLAPERVPKTFP